MDQTRPEIPTELRELMAEIGPQWSPAKYVKLMLEKFSEIHRMMPTEDIDLRADIAYGTHALQKFDVYLPARRGRDRAAVLFAHGGAFLDGHRNRTDEIYANVLRYFARNGIVGINVGYRLADDTPYPGATDDIAAAVAWTHEHADELGIKRNRIFLMGHSAGAAHTGSYAYDRRRHPAGGPGLAGHLVGSGRVRAETRPENPNAHKVISYYGTEAADVLADVSPVSHVDECSVPTFVEWAEFEHPQIDVQCAELCIRLEQ